MFYIDIIQLFLVVKNTLPFSKSTERAKFFFNVKIYNPREPQPTPWAILHILLRI